jgi:hypothetical protein
MHTSKVGMTCINNHEACPMEYMGQNDTGLRRASAVGKAIEQVKQGDTPRGLWRRLLSFGPVLKLECDISQLVIVSSILGKNEVHTEPNTQEDNDG